jgi:hypothetical protein
MANYNYNEVDYAGEESWIDKLEEIDPTSSASSDYTDIHFTKPKTAAVSAMTHPHVTFVRPGGAKTRWYVSNVGGKWKFKNVTGVEFDGQQEIAEKVLADAEGLNWIRAAPPAKVVDKGGFETVEKKGTKKNRMQTGF